MAEEGKVKTDMLFVGLTRVPMLLGVTYKTAMLNALGCMMVYIMSSEMKYMVMAAPIHGFLYYVCSKEPLFLELFLIKNAKCSNARRNKLYHQGNSYDPR